VPASAELYEFVGSCWANVPKIALAETGWKKDDLEWVSINLAEVRSVLAHSGDRLCTNGGATR